MSDSSPPNTEDAAEPQPEEPKEKLLRFTVICGNKKSDTRDVAAVHITSPNLEDAHVRARLTLGANVEGTEAADWEPVLTYLGWQEVIG
jgi:hypothetical protein